MVSETLIAATFNMTKYIYESNIIGGIIEYYTSTIGSVPFFGLMAFGITILAYIWTQSIDFIAVIWIIIGGALEIYIPGPALTIGKVLMILGIFVIFVKVILGRQEYG